MSGVRIHSVIHSPNYIVLNMAEDGRELLGAEGGTDTHRKRTQTEKGQAWQTDVAKRKFELDVSKWRKLAGTLQRILADSKDVEEIRQKRNELDQAHAQIMESFQIAGTHVELDDKIYQNFDAIDQKNYELSLDMNQRIRELQTDDSRSVSRSSRRSSASRSSQKEDSRAEALALRAKLKYLEVESKAKVALEKVQTMKKLYVAEANLNSEDPMTDEEDLDDHDQGDSPSIHSGSQNSKPRNSPTLQRDRTNIHTVSKTPSCSNFGRIDEQPSVIEITKCLADHLNMSRLPTPEPGVFLGDPIQYPSWKAAFNTLIIQRGVPALEKMYYLRKYLGGSAKECVEGYFLVNTEEAFNEAEKRLEERYGDPFEIANAFRDKLEAWPKIGSHDGKSLRSFGDFLKQCETAIKAIEGLRVLDDDRENRKMLKKMPDWLVTRWGRIVADFKEKSCKFPPFTQFVKFVTKEAKIACDPITSLQSLKSKDQPDTASENKRSNRKRTSFMSQTEATDTKSDKEEKYSADGFKKGFNEYKPQPCILCEGSHHLDDCKEFLSKTMAERKQYIRDKFLCFKCLKPGHMSRDCKSKRKCKTCGQRHPTSLHGDRRSSSGLNPATPAFNPRDAQQDQQPVKHCGFSSSHDDGKVSMIVPVLLSHNSRPEHEVLVYALLDTQSDTTFVLDSTREALGIEGTSTYLKLSTMSESNKVVETKKVQGLVARGHNSDSKVILPPAFSRDVMPANRSHIPTADMTKSWPHLDTLHDQLLPLQSCEIGILIGYDCPVALMPREVIPSPSGTSRAPYALRTDLGWSLIGLTNPNYEIVDPHDEVGTSHRIITRVVMNPISSRSGHVAVSEVAFSFKTRVKEVINPQLISQMMEFDFRDRNETGSGLSINDKKFLNKLQTGTRQLEDGHYQMPLPFKEEQVTLPNNRSLARRRLLQLKSRLLKNPQYYSDYVSFMDNLIRNGHAEKVEDCGLQPENKPVWYVPHHGVYHKDKPGKIRVVFDCSARFSEKSLNEVLLQGPDLTSNLVGLLCRLRKERFVLACDIEQMFHQFKVDEEERDFLRFLWWDKGNLERTPEDYRMTVHLFGATSSPGCANYGLKRIADDYEVQVGSMAANFVRQNFYVDDGIISVATEEEGVELLKKTRELCAKGGLVLHKIASNSRKILESVDPEDRVKTIRDLDLHNEILPLEKTLGVQWCLESDTFQFRIHLKDQPLTKRGILSTVSSVYDPLGFVAPVVLTGRQILQEICSLDSDWDTPVPDHIRKKWEAWRTDILHLKNLTIERCFKPRNFKGVKDVELHHFSDASTSGYGQCTYLRLVDDEGNVSCSLVCGKSRVVPLKPVTIPRLELTAAVLSTSVSSKIEKELGFDNVVEVFWTDSKVVLGYLNNVSRRFHVFVANRVQRIHEKSLPSQWHYVESAQNPADIASRGITAKEMSKGSMYLQGPDFLKQQILPSAVSESFVVRENDPEVKTCNAVQTKEVPEQFDLERFHRFPDWNRLTKAIAWCLVYRDALQGHRTEMNVSAMNRAKTAIIRLAQETALKPEIGSLRSLGTRGETRSSLVERQKTLKKSSKLHRLDPFLDDDDVIRVGGRLSRAAVLSNEKYPVILPKRGHITELVIKHFHQKCGHQGRGLTLNEIRANGYWIINGCSVVSNIINGCVTCRKLRGPTETQKMSDLPEDRVSSTPPFTHCGMDYFGPWIIKEGRREVKRYGVIFTCLACRGVHIETAVSMDTSSFINALRRFTAIRGPVRTLRSDRGTNFVGAERELKASLTDLDQTRIKTFLLDQGCDLVSFNMNTPASSHMGGVWERHIRTIRSILSALMHQMSMQLDDEGFRTLMWEVAAIINSRPLTVEALNDHTLEPLSPNQLLTMKSKVILAPPGDFQKTDLYTIKRWRRIQYIANEFWNRWRKEYLQSLQPRQKWYETRDFRMGDIVLLKDPQLPRNHWPMARIVQLYPSEDGRVRKVKLAIGNRSLDGKGVPACPQSYLDRPVHKLVFLCCT